MSHVYFDEFKESMIEMLKDKYLQSGKLSSEEYRIGNKVLTLSAEIKNDGK